MASRDSLGSYERKLRYRKLLENVEELDDAAVNSPETIVKAANVIDEAEKLLRDGNLQERVDHPVEGLLDSRVLLASSNIMTRLADGFSGNTNVYDPDELAEHIKSFPQYWSTISFPRRIKELTYLHGTFLPGPPAERPDRKKRTLEKEKKHTTKEPENVVDSDKSEEASESVQKIHKFISKYFKTNSSKPFSYFNLVLDPNSFEKTIENIYHISFLVRDGLVSIQIDRDTKLPYIAPVSKHDRERDNSDAKGENNQFIISLDMQDWQNAVKTFNVSKSLMKI